MNSSTLTPGDRQILLKLARQCVELAAQGLPPPPISLENYSSDLTASGAAFVTLTLRGALRGCVGGLEAVRPLVEDVCDHAVAAAREDYRFHPVTPAEVGQLEIEISRLTPPQPLDYQSPEELPRLLHPGVDGVILYNGPARATFLPQVWEKLPDPDEFLSHLCQKMGAPSRLWRAKRLRVAVYQVEEFHE